MRKHISRFLTASFCVLFVTLAAQASPILVGTTTDATGVNGLIVDGLEYDVTFSFVSYNDTFGASVPTFWGDLAGADAAAVALAQALQSLGVVGLNGVDKTSREALLSLSIPIAFFPNGQVQDASASSNSPLGLPVVWDTNTGGCFICNPDAVPPPGQGWAVFNATTSPVPEPATLALVGLGLFGLAFPRRSRRS